MLITFRSFQTPEEAKNLVSPKHLPWAVLEGGERAGSEPPFHRLSVELQGFVTEEESGDLILQFLNNRLMRIMFYPTNPDRYVAKLQKRGVTVRSDVERGGLELREPGQPSTLQILLTSDHLGRRYVAWVDLRLDQEYHDLILKHS